MTEQSAHVGEIDLAYEVFGDGADPALLLIMGLGTQMLGWDVEFCELLAARGFFVVRFDNRDVGRSTSIDAAGSRPRRGAHRRRRSASYLLSDMARRLVRAARPPGYRQARTWSARRWAA